MRKNFAVLNAVTALLVLGSFFVSVAQGQAQGPYMSCSIMVGTNQHMKPAIRSAIANQHQRALTLIGKISNLLHKKKSPCYLQRKQQRVRTLFSKALGAVDALPQFIYSSCTSPLCAVQSLAPQKSNVMKYSEKLHKLSDKVAYHYRELLGNEYLLEIEYAQSAQNVVYDAFDYFPPFTTVCE